MTLSKVSIAGLLSVVVAGSFPGAARAQAPNPPAAETEAAPPPPTGSAAVDPRMPPPTQPLGNPPPAAYPATAVYSPAGSAPPVGSPSPPGYAPPGGYPAPGYTPVVASAPAPSTSPLVGRRGFLAMPLLGIHSIEGRNGANDDAGLRIGGLLGGRLGSMFSINGQLTLDAVNAKNLAPGETFSSFKLSLTASPLFHVHQGRAEMVLGPKLGLFGFASTETLPSSGTGSGHGSGYVIGVNAGAFVALGRRLSLGGLLSYESQIYHQSCFTPPGTAESCSGNVGPANPVVGITAALLF